MSQILQVRPALHKPAKPHLSTPLSLSLSKAHSETARAFDKLRLSGGGGGEVESNPARKRKGPPDRSDSPFPASWNRMVQPTISSGLKK